MKNQPPPPPPPPVKHEPTIDERFASNLEKLDLTEKEKKRAVSQFNRLLHFLGTDGQSLPEDGLKKLKLDKKLKVIEVTWDIGEKEGGCCLGCSQAKKVDVRHGHMFFRLSLRTKEITQSCRRSRRRTPIFLENSSDDDDYKPLRGTGKWRMKEFMIQVFLHRIRFLAWEKHAVADTSDVDKTFLLEILQKQLALPLLSIPSERSIQLTQTISLITKQRYTMHTDLFKLYIHWYYSEEGKKPRCKMEQFLEEVNALLIYVSSESLFLQGQRMYDLDSIKLMDAGFNEELATSLGKIINLKVK